MKAIGSLFGGGAQQQGPSEAEALAKKQQAELDKRRAEEEDAKNAQLRLLRGLQGRGGQPTLFSESGTRGLSSTLG